MAKPIGNQWTGDVTCLREIADRIREDGSNWIQGRLKTDPTIKFCAKIFAKPSGFGINGGRISKMDVYKTKPRECLFNYDRGEDIQPKTKAVKQFVNRMLELLDGQNQND